ncbi:MAG: FAD-dependent oxidoreductase [Kiritimatiellae bacterium]|nr:FAD-dependent oxidoreductase [Kiritimatiellia bacterium]
MAVSRREMLRRMGLGSAAGLGLWASNGRADATDGDPEYAGFARNLFKVSPSMEDVPSASIVDGKVIQPAREIPVFHEADVVVVGGGAAGFAAAVAAARSGAKTALIERYGSLGGLFTNGMVLVIIGTGVREDGKFRLVTRGICEEFMLRLEKMGPQAITPHPATPDGVWQPTADAEAAKVLMDTMVQEAKVDLFLHAWGVDVIQAGKAVKGVVFESKQGRQAILAKQVVDASGDGDVYFQAGETYQQISHAMGFVFRVGNADRIDRTKLPKEQKPLRLGNHEPIPGALWNNNLGPRGNGLDIRDLTRIEMLHRKSAWDYVQRARQTPGYEKIFLMNTCSQIGVRATRLLDGVASIDKKEALLGRKREDAVAVSGHDGLRHPEFAIPYGALLPKRIDNLLVAGRCISCAPDLIDRVRLIPVCFVTGQAAGVAAALAAKKGCTPRELDVREIRSVLLEQHAYL